MSPLPLPRGADLVRALQRAGFVIARIKGSHHIMRHADGRKTVVPVHGSRVIAYSLLKKILGQAGISEDEYLNLV